MKKHLVIFITGFAQVFLVSANTYFISRTTWLGIAVCGFGISYLWTINVRRVTIGTRTEQIVYSTVCTPITPSFFIELPSLPLSKR